MLPNKPLLPEYLVKSSLPSYLVTATKPLILAAVLSISSFHYITHSNFLAIVNMMNLSGYISYSPNKVNGKLFHQVKGEPSSHAPLTSTTTNVSVIKRTVISSLKD